MKNINQVKKMVALILASGFLFSSSVRAHNGDWFQSNEPGRGRLDFFMPMLIMLWNISPNLRAINSRNTQQAGPIHVVRNNGDSAQTHITFGTDSYEGDNSQFPRYAYYPNWTGDDARWRILGSMDQSTYRSHFMTYADFQAQVRSDIRSYQRFLNSHPDAEQYVNRLINDARAAIGEASDYGLGGNSILVTWWRDYSQQAPPSSSGTPPSPTPNHGEL